MRKLLAGLGLSVTLLVVVAPAAWAGGWAVSTLDPMSAPVAGVPTDIGFTIRQHGVTPVDVNDVTIVVTAPSGETAVFPANGDGVEGHYVTVGDLRGRPIDLADPSRVLRTPGPRCDHRCCGHVERSRFCRVVVVPVSWCGPARLVPLAAIALTTVAIADAIVSRRKKSPVSSAPRASSPPSARYTLGVASIIGWGSSSSADQPAETASAELNGRVALRRKGVRVVPRRT